MTKVDLVDVGGGNIGSVKRCLEMMNIDFLESNIHNPPSGERPVLLPGVGAFGPVMEHLRNTGFDQRIKDLVNAGTPYLGICVGMQILFESSEEAKGINGLGLVKGTVRKFQEGKVPQIGWNLVQRAHTSSGTTSSDTSSGTKIRDHDLKSTSGEQNLDMEYGALTKSSYPDSGYVYFVNSYFPDPESSAAILYSSNYYVQFCAAIQTENITAFQFHPEKSGAFGKALLAKWVQNVA